MTKRHRKPDPSAWQKEMLDGLRALAVSKPDYLLRASSLGVKQQCLVVKIVIATASIPHVEGGMLLGDTETFLVAVPDSPLIPPTVWVPGIDPRFLGFPHVLQGLRVCIYLDPFREWNPDLGAVGLLDRLWQWLGDASSARFDPRTAMYHAVGGVLAVTEGTPTVVVRGASEMDHSRRSYLVERTSNRLDLVDIKSEATLCVPIFPAQHPFPVGVSDTLQVLVATLGDQGQAFLTALMTSAVRNNAGTPQYFILSVPHPANGPRHILAGRVSLAATDGLRAILRREGTGATIPVNRIREDIKIEWCNMSDERSVVSTRRDDNRPVNGFLGKTVILWGCGGLGSWMGDFITRAGAARITVCDFGVITGGLLVRQDYSERDVGRSKADALAERLRTIRDDVEIVPINGSVPGNVSESMEADVVIDATVSVAVSQLLDEATVECPARRCWLVQAAVDAKTGTAGIVNISAPGQDTLTVIDTSAHAFVASDGFLEDYVTLWDNPSRDDELIPTLGCSVPTFHGSAADLAALAGVMTTLIGSHLTTVEAVSGTHLLSLPGSQIAPNHRFIPYFGTRIIGRH